MGLVLHGDVTTYFESSVSPEAAMQTIDGGHGRIETRTLRVSDELDWLEKEHSWIGLKSILAVTAKRKVGNKGDRRLSILEQPPSKLVHAVRAHWSIENNLHWVLDVAFDEDSNRTRKGYSAANLAVTRHIAFEPY
ncbi:MAG: ISAs1 family transposase [Methylococcales bacterium]